MEKLDLIKQYKSYFKAPKKPELLDIEPAVYLSVSGKGDPSGKPFAERIEALYSVAYSVKFEYKAQGKDFTVSKLEGLWWYDEVRYPAKTIDGASLEVPRDEWEYRLLIRLPDFVEEDHVRKAVAAVLKKKDTDLAGEVAVFRMEEGKVVQILHEGPFATEPETLKILAAFMQEKQLLRNGLHHEIYLSDFRKTKPDRLKTILREPVKLH